MSATSPHLAVVRDQWQRCQQQSRSGSYVLDGNSLHIGDVVATAESPCFPIISKDSILSENLDASVNVLFNHLKNGWYVYGVNTGFGGSADARTEEVVKLQSSLMQHTQSGILSASSDGEKPGHSMPANWVRAAMVVRCNATIRGHSAVSMPVIRALTGLLQHGLTPVVPLRGSISASGDLMPLAYVAGALEGNPDILLEKDGKVLPADQMLSDYGLPRVLLGPKEGLSLINGTSSSAGLGALVIAEAHRLAFLTQVLSAGAVEALRGSSESFHPFIAQSRPHPGQIECARNIYHFLRGSRLSRDVLEPKNRRREDLVQDRYSLRSAPQWIGPQLEDLLLSDQQIRIELNSSCDNPLVDSEAQDIYYGCNFQASSVTSAMEKTRLALQMCGRILFAQSTEMIDPTLSGGLPANLAADDPSLSYMMKGVDVNMAAYMAELSFLAAPMSSHVQAAEMHNQSVNSMALASARMSYDAVDILNKMSACSVYIVCQALDLRALHLNFIQEATIALKALTKDKFASLGANELQSLLTSLADVVAPLWGSTNKLDLNVRCEQLVLHLLPTVAAATPSSTVSEVLGWKTQAIETTWQLWKGIYQAFVAKPHTPEMLGKGSKVIYDFVRGQLMIPFHQGFVEHPTSTDHVLDGRKKRTIGGWISVIHDSIKRGEMHDRLMASIGQELLGHTETGTSNGILTNGYTNQPGNGFTSGHVQH